MKRVVSVTAVAVFAAGAWAQDPPKQDPAQAHAKVDQKRVDDAIKNGVKYLRTVTPGLGKPLGNTGKHPQRNDELVLWTLVHAGVPESDPEFQRLFKNMMATDLERTYLVSLQAMILEEMDRVKYQWRIHQCAQFLVDNLGRNGQWTYGEISYYVTEIPVPTGGNGGGADVATSGGSGSKPPAPRPVDKRGKPKVLKKVTVKKEKEGPASGDNSNSQYAALGIRACHDAGVVFPKECLQLAEKWWRAAQYGTKSDSKDGGYGVTADGEGWCYGPKDSHQPYGSMTAGALGSLVIYDYVLAKDWRKDKDVLAGLQWITKRFSVTENVGPPEHADGNVNWMYYYYLYALERAGILYGTEKFGEHEWYPEGANVLLDAQKPNGAWTSKEHGNAVWDTCFAILFLRRATRPLEDVATGGSGKR